MNLYRRSGTRTVQLLVQDIQLRIGVVDDLVHLNVKGAVLVRQSLSQILLVDSGRSQQLQKANDSASLHLLRRLIAPKGQSSSSTFHDCTWTKAAKHARLIVLSGLQGC